MRLLPSEPSPQGPEYSGINDLDPGFRRGDGGLRDGVYLAYLLPRLDEMSPLPLAHLQFPLTALKCLRPARHDRHAQNS